MTTRMNKHSNEEHEPLVVPAITDEDPMTSRRVTRQPRKKNPVASAVSRLTSAATKKIGGRRSG